jgi:hypothetical protein
MVSAPRNSFGTVALTLGIVGALLTITVLGVIFAAPVALAAIVFGGVGLRMANWRRGIGKATNPGQAKAGIVLGVFSLLFDALLIIAGWYGDTARWSTARSAVELLRRRDTTHTFGISAGWQGPGDSTHA